MAVAPTGHLVGRNLGEIRCTAGRRCAKSSTALLRLHANQRDEVTSAALPEALGMAERVQNRGTMADEEVTTADARGRRATDRQEATAFDRPPKIPRPILVLGGWGWRITAIAAGTYVILWVVLRVWVVLLPLLVALFLAAALEPVVDWLRRRRWPSALATTVVFFAALTLVVVIIGWISVSVGGQLGQLRSQVQQGIEQLQQALTAQPFVNLSEQRLDELQSRIFGAAGQGGLVQRAMSGASLVVQIATGIVLMLFTLFFLLKDGQQMGGWLRDRIPERFHDDVTGVAGAVQRVMREYLGGTVLVGLVDAVLIGVALLVLGVPLVLPLATITFFGAFVPVVGATVAGALSALVALVSGGLTVALWVVGVTILVQQIEGNLLQPLVMGAAVSLHPIVTIYTVTIGFLLGGIVGAFVAVPLTAMAAQVGHFYRARNAAEA